MTIRLANNPCKRCGIRHDLDALTVGDEVEILAGEHAGRHGMLWEWRQWSETADLTMSVRIPGGDGRRETEYETARPCELKRVAPCPPEAAKGWVISLWVEKRLIELGIREVLIDLIKNRTSCGCCDSDTGHARAIELVMRQIPERSWPKLEDTTLVVGGKRCDTTTTYDRIYTALEKRFMPPP